MANPQLEDGYPRIANELIEKDFTQINLSKYESRILWALLRQTYGWQKEEKAISVSRFVKYTGMKRRHVQRTLTMLVSRNIFTKKDGYTNTYGFQKDYEKWDCPLSGKQGKCTPTGAGLKTSTLSGAGVAPKEVHIKEKRNIRKDIVTKEGLATFPHTLNDIPLRMREEVLHFLDRVRQGNEKKQIAPSRIEKIVSELMSVSEQYGEDHLITAIQKTVVREVFNWGSRNVTGYARQIAKSLYEQSRQREVEGQSRVEKKTLAGAKGSELYNELVESMGEKN